MSVKQWRHLKPGKTALLSPKNGKNRESFARVFNIVYYYNTFFVFLQSVFKTLKIWIKQERVKTFPPKSQEWARWKVCPKATSHCRMVTTSKSKMTESNR
nr:MAG TPA_asm: hypothetical protein [Caudoviricetes sp.]